jgi:hypothetical protein
VTAIDKHSSLVQSGINYTLKKVFSTGPGELTLSESTRANVVKLFAAVIY